MAWPLFLPSSARVRLGQIGPFGLLPYHIPVIDRHTHFYCIGTTGQGKSKFLESLLVADIRAGRGCGVVDPHTDLARDTLTHLLSVGFFNSEAARQRVIYFDPTRTDYVIPFNILKTPAAPYALAQQVIEAFRRTWPQALEEAPRFSNIALACLLVLIETGQSLVDMAPLLTNKLYRERLLAQVRDPQLVEFFHTRLDQWGREGPLMIESTLNKVSAFAFNPHLKRLLGASENRLDFRAIMDAGQVLIVDLGNCDGETRRLLGSLVVTGMETAALSRKDQPDNRKPFYLFLDEFQDFCAGDGAAKTLAQILSECRKFGLHLHLAHQTLGQVHHRVSSALGNVGIKVVFAVDREDAEVMAKKLFAADTEEIKHDAQTETQHPLFSPLGEQWERATATIQELPLRTALVKRRGHTVIQMQTQPIRTYGVQAGAVDELMRDLARRHGIPASQISEANTTAHPARPPIQLTDWEPLDGSPSRTSPPQSASRVIYVNGDD
jgi:Type IV secretion-system coupling protein DNA-binding domain